MRLSNVDLDLLAELLVIAGCQQASLIEAGAGLNDAKSYALLDTATLSAKENYNRKASGKTLVNSVHLYEKVPTLMPLDEVALSQVFTFEAESGTAKFANPAESHFPASLIA